MKQPPVIAYVGLGSNLDHPCQHILRALDELEQHPDLTLLARSSLYQTPPMGPADQPNFINAVAKISTPLPAQKLLNTLQAIEQDHQRCREGPRWGPRTLDLDLLLYGQQCIHTPHLQVPHPGIGERNFVLYPMQEVDPEINIPNVGPIALLIKQLTDPAPRVLQMPETS